MRPGIFSMRWWLALAFASIAALTALVVSQVFTASTEDAIRARARELAAGAAVTAAAELAGTSRGELPAKVSELGDSRELALFVLDENGALLTPGRARGVDVESLPNFRVLSDTALGGRRLVETLDDGRVVTVALPLRGESASAMIAVAARPELEDAVGIVRDEIIRAALWAVAAGAAVGLGLALLTTRRLRRVAVAAADIEQGRFDRELHPRFRDELGELERTIDRMRVRLRESFEELEAERDRLDRLLEQLQEGVVAVDGRLVVQFANSRARSLLGDDLAVGEKLPDPWPAPSLVEVARSLFDPAADGAVTRVHPASGTTYDVAMIPPGRGSEIAVVVVTDVSEQERRERAEREFVTNAAHELRTPLSAIVNAVEVLQHGAKERPEDRDRFLAVVERQTARLTRLAHALLTLARAQTRSESVRLELVRISEIVRSVVADVGGSEVVSDVDEEIEVLAHAGLLQQALENLVANAAKHAPGGVVTVRTVRTGGTVRLEVADDGPGMSALESGRALDRFYRVSGSSSDGFGLGLSIVREAVHAMRGTLSIESRSGVGTTVAIVLDAAPAPVSVP